MELENLNSNKATQIFAKALFLGKITIFLHAAVGAALAVDQGREFKTRWFTAQIEPSWRVINDSDSLAVVILQNTAIASISLNIIRTPSASNLSTSQAILADYRAAGFSDIKVEALPISNPGYNGDSVVVRYRSINANDQAQRLSVVGRWTTLDDSTLWLTLVAPVESREQAIDLYKKFLTGFVVTDTPATRAQQSNTRWELILSAFALIGVAVWCYSRAARAR